MAKRVRKELPGLVRELLEQSLRQNNKRVEMGETSLCEGYEVDSCRRKRLLWMLLCEALQVIPCLAVF